MRASRPAVVAGISVPESAVGRAVQVSAASLAVMEQATATEGRGQGAEREVPQRHELESWEAGRERKRRGGGTVVQSRAGADQPVKKATESRQLSRSQVSGVAH